MSRERSMVTDVLIARALAERAGVPDVDMLSPIMVAVSSAPQRRGWAVRLGLGHRTAVLGFAAVALVVWVVVAAVAGSMIIRPGLVERPLPGNGPITVQLDGGLVEVDPLTGRRVAEIRVPPSSPGYTTDLSWSPDGSHLAIATDLTLSIIDLTTGQTTSPITCAFCPVA